MNRRLTWTALILAAAIVRADDVDDAVLAELRRQRIPGLSLAVVRAGTVVKAQGYGLANVEHQVPAKPETVYQSGSLGKQFTAAAVLLLAEDGKLGLDDPIAKYLGGPPEPWRGITVRQLLTHTAGVKNYNSKDIDYRKAHTEAELVAKAAALPPDFAPGADWRYSNTGYLLLGAVIRGAAGEFYGDVLTKRVFGPLGMDTARIISEADIVPNRAAGYRLSWWRLKNQDWVSPELNTTADGSLYLTVLDLAKWDAALDTDRLLKRASREQMWTPATTTDGKTHPYGFGWQIETVNGRKVVRHGGRWQGFTAHLAKYRDDRLTVIVLTNLAGADAGRIARDVAGGYVPALAPAKPKADPE